MTDSKPHKEIYKSVEHIVVPESKKVLKQQ